MEACQEAFKTSIILIMKEDLAAFLNSPALKSDKSFEHAINFLRYLARRMLTKGGDRWQVITTLDEQKPPTKKLDHVMPTCKNRVSI